jgi:hypothetical protein
MKSSGGLEKRALPADEMMEVSLRGLNQALTFSRIFTPCFSASIPP